MTKELENVIIWAENKTGVFFRILFLFRKKQINIESVTAGHTEIPGITRITVTVEADRAKLKNICHQVYKLIDVIKAEHIKTEDLVYRELAMMKIKIKEKEEKSEALRVIEHFRGRVMNMTKNTLIIEVTGREVKIDAFYENMKDFTIVEFVRTGRTGLLK